MNTFKKHGTSEGTGAAEMKSERGKGPGPRFDAKENMRFNPYDDSLEEVVKERIKTLAQELLSSNENK